MSTRVRTKKDKVTPLGALFVTAVVSAGAAIYGHDYVRDQLQVFVTWRVPLLAGYAVTFIASFIVFSFISHHISFGVSAKAMGMETVQGIAPKIARAILVAFIFAAPLFFSGQKSDLQQSAMSLQAIIESQREPAAGGEAGYKETDREKLDRIIHEGMMDDY